MATTPRSFRAGDLIVSCEPWLWAFKWKEYGKTCAFCCVEREGLSACSACKVHRYCSPSCQKADWKNEHKVECSVLKYVSGFFAEKPHECESFRCSCTSIIMVEKLGRKLKMRFNEFMTDEYCMPLLQRRSYFERAYGRACSCRKCTKEYEAEINPLLCVTAGCMERIPSDERASEPCVQCGAMNADRLKTYRQMVKKYDGIWKNTHNLTELVAKKSLLLAEIDAAGILHPDAHIRFTLGWHLAMYDFRTGNYEKGLRLLLEMIVCIRSIFPTYNCDRAMGLFDAAKAVICALKKFILDQSGMASSDEKMRLMCMLNDTAPTAYGWYKEARTILATLLGEDSVAVKMTDNHMEEVERHLEGDFHKIMLMALLK